MNPTQDTRRYKDSRAFKRLSHDASIMFSHYGSGKYALGKMRNYSPCGCYFETDKALSKGTDIFIKMVDAPKFWKKIGFNGGGRARVVWCGEASDKPHSRYGVGVHIDWLGSALSGIVNDLNNA